MEFERQLAKHKDAVYRQLFHVCGNREDAEDALAESMTNAFRSLGSLRDPGSFRAWMVQIGRRACGRLQKTGRAVSTLERLEEIGMELPSNADSPEELALEAETKACLNRVLDQLPEIYRSAYVKFDLEDKSLQEAAAELGIPIPTMKTRLRRARGMVRDAVDRELSCP